MGNDYEPSASVRHPPSFTPSDHHLTPPFLSSEHVVDRRDPVAAVAEIRKLTDGRLKYALDCISRDTATLAEQALDESQDTWLVGLSGLPKVARGKTQLREVVSNSRSPLPRAATLY